LTPQSIRSAFDKDLASIQDMLLRMGGLLDRALTRSMESLESMDEAKARQVVADDQAINDLRFDIEDSCLATIARQQPAAGDLRRLVSAMNIVLDLERIGDYAAGISKTVIRLKEEEAIIDPPPGLLHMYEMARSMLKGVLEVYAEGDAKRARKIAAKDDMIDEQYKALFRELLGQMGSQPNASERALYLLFAGHNLERIADRVTNIAERVVFMQSGEMEELNIESSEPEGAG
jgi:phosphate transport system protein